MNQAGEKRKVSGIIESILFKNNDNGYTVLELDVGGHPLTAVGVLPLVCEGECVELEGETVRSKYGEQFKIENYRSLPPRGPDAIVRYLSSGLVKGVGEVTASNIVERFGEDTLDVIEFSPARLAEVKGVSEKKAFEIATGIKSLKEMQSTVMFLQSLGISVNMALKIYKKYGQNSEPVLKENPYRLVEDVDGIGFLTADKLALNLGVGGDSDFRIRAGIVYILKDTVSSEGSTYCEVSTVSRLLHTELNIRAEGGEERVGEILRGLAIDGQVKLFELDGVAMVSLASVYNTEKACADKLVRLEGRTQELRTDVRADIAEFERAEGITLDEGQKTAVENCLLHSVSVITGGPGTGKTTIIKCVLFVLTKCGQKVQLAAPTGRAAKRLSESTGEDARTIHRLLDLNFKDGKGFFTFNEHTKLDCDAVIIDEVSMIDVYLFQNLLSAVKVGARLVLIGDKDQLPSVDVGNVLSDLIESGLFSVSCLVNIYRQSEDSNISFNAHRINNGEFPVFPGKESDFFLVQRESAEDIFATTLDLVKNRLPKFLNAEPEEIQVLVPMKKGVCGAVNLNKALQELLNPKGNKKEYVCGGVSFREGDKVMQTANNYALEWVKYGRYPEYGSGIFNGDIGRVREVKTTGEVEVLFEDRVVTYGPAELSDLALSYAISIHKSQGSEFDYVVIPVTGGPPSLFNRNLLYTAVTRGKKLVALVGERRNVENMIRNHFIRNRKTQLARFLKERAVAAQSLGTPDADLSWAQGVLTEEK